MGLLEVAENIVDLLLNHVLSILLVGRCIAKPSGVNAIEGVRPHTPLTKAPPSFRCRQHSPSDDSACLSWSSAEIKINFNVKST